ncbi:MAG: ABC transporter ATP-binding protein [Methylocystaceae bacterium]
MLEINNLHVYYGNIHALQGIDLVVNEGEMVAILGANGAGKTTTLRAVSGLVKVQQGRIAYRGRNLIGANSHQIVAAGLIQVPEGRQIFSSLTVEENLRLGAYQRRDREQAAKDRAWVYEQFPILKERSHQVAGTLSGGEQQMLAIGRAVMSSPQLLLLDEPSLGLAPLIVELIFNTISHFRERGMTILLVEQNAYQALALADRAYVLETGRVKISGSSAELLDNEEVKKAYLGG